jgi:hypothetical protein
MSLMHHAIKNRIRDGWIWEETVPSVRGVLTGQKQRSRAHAPVGNIEQDLRCGWVPRFQSHQGLAGWVCSR